MSEVRICGLRGEVTSHEMNDDGNGKSALRLELLMERKSLSNTLSVLSVHLPF